jgi:hypothetical protein
VDPQPDIVVVSPDELTTHLIVEVSLAAAEAEKARGLKRQMIRMRVPTGLLVTPETISIYRDTFRSYEEGAIHKKARLPTSAVPELQRFANRTNSDPIAFEDAVQDWLTNLKYRSTQGYLKAGDLTKALKEHVLPALDMGEVRAAGPRLFRPAAAH